MTTRRALAAAIGLVMLASPAGAVGMGPLSKSGITDGPAKGFWLTIINPYADLREFRAYPLSADSGESVGNVAIRLALSRTPPNGSRRILVTVSALAPGEVRRLRVCAELAQAEGTLHARICSALTARRVARAS